jgi:hypothetical protein
MLVVVIANNASDMIVFFILVSLPLVLNTYQAQNGYGWLSKFLNLLSLVTPFKMTISAAVHSLNFALCETSDERAYKPFLDGFGIA